MDGLGTEDPTRVGLLWHIGAFLILNAFFWFLDLVIGQEGIQWAFWITLFWGLALAFHALAWAVADRQSARPASTPRSPPSAVRDAATPCPHLRRAGALPPMARARIR